VLCPAEIRRAKGNEEYSLEYSEEEYFVNTTLLEYLKQAFNIDVRALGGDVTRHKISELIKENTRVDTEIKDLKNMILKK